LGIQKIDKKKAWRCRETRSISQRSSNLVKIVLASITAIMTVTKPIQIGVFIPNGCQLLDMSSIDLFGMLEPKYLAVCKLPASLIALGVPSEIHYISTLETGNHVELTASAFIRVSKTTKDPEVQPGMLDILLVPGPDPSLIFGEDVLDFLRGHVEWKGIDGKQTDILSVCTGCLLLAQAGVLQGKKASGPRLLVPMLQKQFPGATWIDDKRWVNDGNIWMSGKTCHLLLRYIRFRN
jgi:transcriptional regulator GlxA family with amidase domain